MLKHQDMAVTGARRAPFNRRVRWHRVGAGVALISITIWIEMNGHFGLATGYIDEWDADGAAVIKTRTKIRMNRSGRTNRVHIGIRTRITGQAVDWYIPHIIRREDVTIAELGRDGGGRRRRCNG